MRVSGATPSRKHLGEAEPPVELIGPSIDLQHAESYPLALCEGVIEQRLDEPSADATTTILGGDLDEGEKALITMVFEVKPADIGTR
jgi:hypothetical protein